LTGETNPVNKDIKPISKTS